MPRVNIIVEDSMVVVDGVGRRVDLTPLGIPAMVWAVSWDGSEAEIEGRNKTVTRSGDAVALKIAEVIALWDAAAPPPPVPVEPPPTPFVIKEEHEISLKLGILAGDYLLSDTAQERTRITAQIKTLRARLTEAIGAIPA